MEIANKERFKKPGSGTAAKLEAAVDVAAPAASVCPKLVRQRV
jgi:hypothetical protein